MLRYSFFLFFVFFTLTSTLFGQDALEQIKNQLNQNYVPPKVLEDLLKKARNYYKSQNSDSLSADKRKALKNYKLELDELTDFILDLRLSSKDTNAIKDVYDNVSKILTNIRTRKNLWGKYKYPNLREKKLVLSLTVLDKNRTNEIDIDSLLDTDLKIPERRVLNKLNLKYIELIDKLKVDFLYIGSLQNHRIKTTEDNQAVINATKTGGKAKMKDGYKTQQKRLIEMLAQKNLKNVPEVMASTNNMMNIYAILEEIIKKLNFDKLEKLDIAKRNSKTNQYKLTDSHKTTISKTMGKIQILSNKIDEIYNAYPSDTEYHCKITLSIDGYADSPGDEEYNRKLSQRRANAAYKYCQELIDSYKLSEKVSVDTSSTRVVGRGEEIPPFLKTKYDRRDGDNPKRRVTALFLKTELYRKED